MKKLFLCIPLFTLLCACWDYREPNMQEYVLGIGVDFERDGTYLLTVETADLSTPPESASKSRTFTAEGINLFDAIQNAESQAGKMLYWGHLGVIVFDEEITQVQLRAALDLFNRTRDIYQNVALLIAHGASAHDVFQTEPRGASSTTEHVQNLMRSRAPSHRFQTLELWEFTRSLSQTGYALLPTVTVTNNTCTLDGGIITNETEQIAYLNGEEVFVFSLLTEENISGFLPQVEIAPNKTVSLEVLSSHVSKESNAIHITLSVSVSSADFYLDLKNNNIESITSHLIREQMTALIVRAQREHFISLLKFPQSVDVTVRLHHAGMYHDHPEAVA